MKKKSLRWYQKDEYLNAFLNLLQSLTLEQQCEIAIDIIVKSSSLIDRDYTKIIQSISKFNPKDYKRWYDKNPSVHLAVELLRDLDEEQREEILQEFSSRIVDKYSVETKEND